VKTFSCGEPSEIKTAQRKWLNPTVNLFFPLSARSEAGGGGVYCHFQVIEDQPHIESEFSHFLRHAVDAFGFDHADGEAA
jgi:hypothetical protein